jgi:catechol 2,3-dioxygenase-like lactoylglutathione lyase family enzyme
MNAVIENPVSGSVSKTHVSLNVRNIEASVAFYEAFFSQPAHKRRPGYANFDVANPPLKLAIQEFAPAESGTSRLSHLGIVVGSAAEVNAARERLEASGVVSFDEGDTVCCYARQDKVWATDPDGNSWEVYVLLDEMDDHEDHEFEGGKVGLPMGADACCSASARAKAGGPACCVQPSDGSACCP